MTNPAIHSLNWVDYTIIGIIVFSTVISFFRGFIREAVSLVVWIVGVLVALKFSSSFQGYFSQWVASPTIRYGLAFVSIFLIIFILGILVNALIHATIKGKGLSVADRFLGVIFGAARGILIVAVLLMFVSVGKVKDGSSIAQSRLAPEFSPLVVWLNSFLPDQVKELSQWVSDDNDFQETP